MIERFKRLASRQNSLFGATALLIATTLLSNILGMLRDRFLAQKIATDMLDTYFAALRVPDLLFNFLILGTVSAAFIPVLIQYRAKSDREAWEVASIILTFAVLVLVVLCILLAILMPNLIPFVVPDFSPEKQALTIILSRILLIQPIFFGISYLFSGILNATKRFVVYAFAPLIYNMSIIIATVFFADQYGVKAVVWGVVGGALLHMLIQFLTVRNLGIRLVPNLNLAHPAMKKILTMMWPRSIALGGMQLMLLIFTAIGSSLGPGSVAVYSLADNIQTMPTAVFALSFTTAIFPTLSEAAAGRKFNELAALVWRGIRYLLVIMVPSGIGLILIRAQLVRIILGTGHFDWQATQATADTLGLLAISLIFQSIVVHLSRTYYALHNTKKPTLFNVIGYACSIILAYWLAPMSGLGMGVPGLALAFSIGSFVNAALLYISIRRDLPQIVAKELAVIQLIMQIAIASVVLFIAVQLAKIGIASVVDMTRFWGVLLQTAGAILAGCGVYWLVLRWFKVAELTEITLVLASRLKLKLSQPVAATVDVEKSSLE